MTNNDNIIKTLSSISKHQAFISLSKFLQKYDLQEQEMELSENDFNELCSKVNSFRGLCESAISKLDSNDPLNSVLELLLNSYSFQFNQVQIQNERLIEENEQIKNLHEDNKDIDQLLTEISDLKSQLTKAKLTISTYESEEDAKEQAINNIIQSISDTFDLPSPEDEYQLIEELHNLIDGDQGTIKNIIKTFDLPAKTTNDDIIYHLKEKMDGLNNSGITGKLREQLLQMTDELREAKNEIERLKNSNTDQPASSRNEGSEFIGNNNDMPTEQQILECFEYIPLNSEDIPNIIKSDSPLLEKLKQIASSLSLSAFSNESLLSEKEMLLSVVSALFKFIKSLANSEKVYANIYSSSENPFDEIRQTLLAEAESVHLFLQQHAIGIVEDSCLFEELVKRDESDLLDNIQKYLLEHSKPTSTESEELFIMLLQAISAADVLRKYSSQMQIFNRQQEKDFKKIKNYSEQLEKSFGVLTSNSAVDDNTKVDPNSTATKIIISSMSPLTESQSTPKSATKSTPKSSAKSQKSTANVTPKAATDSNKSNLKEDSPNQNNDDIVQNLQKEVDELKESNNELKNEKEEMKKKSHSDFLKIQEKVEKMKANFNQKISQKNKTIQKLSSALKETENKINELTTENENLQKRVNNVLDRSIQEEEADKQLAQNVQDFQEKLDGAKEEMENVKERLKQEMSEFAKEKDKEIQDLQEQLDQSVANSKKISARAQKVSQELQKAYKKIEVLQQRENESIDQANELGKKYQSIHDDISKLEAENEKLKSDIKTTQDLSKREIKLSQTKYEQKISQMKKDHQADINKVIEEKKKENQEILLDFARAFPSYMELGEPLTRESVNKGIQKVKKACESDQKLQKKREILANIRKTLNVEKDIEIPGTLSTYIKNHNDILDKSQVLTDEANVGIQIQSWLNRVYVLCTGGVCQEFDNIKMERCVEEVLINSFGSTILSRKVAMLRAEKKLLLKDVMKIPEKKQKLSLRHLLIISMLILKSKALSGHSDTKQYSFINPSEFENINVNNNNKIENTQNTAPMGSFIYSVD